MTNLGQRHRFLDCLDFFNVFCFGIWEIYVSINWLNFGDPYYMRVLLVLTYLLRRLARLHNLKWLNAEHVWFSFGGGIKLYKICWLHNLKWLITKTYYRSSSGREIRVVQNLVVAQLDWLVAGYVVGSLLAEGLNCTNSVGCTT